MRHLKSPGGAFVPLTRAHQGGGHRSIEPVGKVEWRIEKAMQKGKAPAFEASEALFQELKKPLAVKSPAFAIRGKCRGPDFRDVHRVGIRDGHLEFFPDGHNNSPDGKAGSLLSTNLGCEACLRLFMPPQAASAHDVKVLPPGSPALPMLDRPKQRRASGAGTFSSRSLSETEADARGPALGG